MYFQRARNFPVTCETKSRLAKRNVASSLQHFANTATLLFPIIFFKVIITATKYLIHLNLFWLPSRSTFEKKKQLLQLAQSLPWCDLAACHVSFSSLQYSKISKLLPKKALKCDIYGFYLTNNWFYIWLKMALKSEK